MYKGGSTKYIEGDLECALLADLFITVLLNFSWEIIVSQKSSLYY